MSIDLAALREVADMLAASGNPQRASRVRDAADALESAQHAAEYVRRAAANIARTTLNPNPGNPLDLRCAIAAAIESLPLPQRSP